MPKTATRPLASVATRNRQRAFPAPANDAGIAASSMRLRYAIDIDYDVEDSGAEFIFNVQAARTARQSVVQESLRLGKPPATTPFEDPATRARFLRVTAAPGKLKLRYAATVDIDQHFEKPSRIRENDVVELPNTVLPYIYPSRYCESDRLMNFAWTTFGSLKRGYDRVRAIEEWVQTHVAFRSGSTNGTTSACSTMLERQGVCRDFAHLMIALCRASNVPARFATGIDYGADPALGPQDFHAYVEAYVGGRWRIFDPSGTAIPAGFVRIGTGRDAADVAFATIFGMATMARMKIAIEALPGADGVLRLPERTAEAISTDD